MANVARNEEAIEKLEKFKASIRAKMDAPYFPKKEVEAFVLACDNFVNRTDNPDWIAAIQTIIGEDYVQEYIKEKNISVPETAEEALQFELDVASVKLAGIHRQLQSNFFILLLGFIKYQSMVYDAGSDLYDPRNEWAVETCKKIQGFLEKEGLDFIFR